MYWINPLAYGLRALLVNEMNTPDWDTPVSPLSVSGCEDCVGGGIRSHCEVYVGGGIRSDSSPGSEDVKSPLQPLGPIRTRSWWMLINVSHPNP